jgi:hypothetical protein
VVNLRFVEIDLRGYVHGLAVHDQEAATLLAHFGQDEVQFLAVLLEHGGAQLDLCSCRQRQDGFEDLAGRPAGRGLAGARAVRLGDGGVEQIQVAGNVGHGTDG